MSKLPRITGQDALKAFRRLGFGVDRVRGSHHILKKPGHQYHLSLPVHRGRTVTPGTLKSLIEAAGVSVEEFLAQLE